MKWPEEGPQKLMMMKEGRMFFSASVNSHLTVSEGVDASVSLSGPRGSA